jgi:hypothetical protein
MYVPIMHSLCQAYVHCEQGLIEIDSFHVRLGLSSKTILQCSEFTSLRSKIKSTELYRILS